MGFLGKNAILSADDFQYDVVSCPEWGGDVRVRGLTAADQSFISKLSNSDKKEVLTLNVFIRGVVDENGERIFTTDDFNELKKKPYAVIERVALKIIELTSNGSADTIEELRKN